MQNSIIPQATESARRAVDAALAGGASAARVVAHQGETVGCDFEAGRLKSVSNAQSVDLGVTVIAEGRTGWAGGNDLSALEELAERATTLAKEGSAAHFERYPAPGEIEDVPMHSPDTMAISREDLIEAGTTYAQAMKQVGDDLFILAGGERRESETLIVTSGGVCESYRETAWDLSGGVQKTGEDGDIFMAGAGRSWKDPAGMFDPEYLIERTKQDLRRAETTAEPLRGKVTALLTPSMLKTLLRAVAMGVNGRNVARGNSPLRDRLGERIAAEGFSLIDDPHAPYAGGSCPISDEGVPTCTTPIIEQGVLKSFLYDLDSAGLAGADPTGHDGCRPYSLTVPPGETPSEELLADIEDGIYVSYLMGFGQGNLINGDFSCNVGRGFRIRDGEVVGRLKNTMIAGNVYELLAGNVQLSSDTEPDKRMPYAVVEGVTLSAE
jgi:PmbA protein